jgi:hypothetical protein
MAMKCDRMMPCPDEQEGETDFMWRCLSHLGMMDVFADPTRRTAVCQTLWTHHPNGGGGTQMSEPLGSLHEALRVIREIFKRGK